MLGTARIIALRCRKTLVSVIGETDHPQTCKDDPMKKNERVQLLRAAMAGRASEVA